ncbi:MAG: hypothetical protein ACJAS1_004698 [Oleiphilaceae bacterium]|jgi:hypothetical protein
MRKEEAVCIGNAINKIALEHGGPLLNIGSSTREFREKIQPHVYNDIFAPLENLGVKVIHSDLKADDGVDVSGDLLDPEVQARLATFKPKVILASNLLEHLSIEVREKLPEVLSNILASGGYLIISVPYSYPLHFDPIDTYYRPSPDELCKLLPDYTKVEAKVILSTNYMSDLKKSNLKFLIIILIRLFTPFYKPKKWISIAHRFFWLFRPYKVSFVVLRK